MMMRTAGDGPSVDAVAEKGYATSDLRRRGTMISENVLLDMVLTDAIEYDQEHKEPVMATTPRLEEAFAYAANLHRHQVRKISGIPYLIHLIGVASIVGEYGGDEDQLIAALLHDGPEDQGGHKTLDEIRQRFGDRVAMIVEECSDTLESPKPPWKERKQAYLDHLPKASPDARLVSASDKLHNARSILLDLRRRGSTVWNNFKGGRTGTLWYFGELVREFEHADTENIGKELSRVIDEIKRFPSKEKHIGDGRLFSDEEVEGFRRDVERAEAAKLKKDIMALIEKEPGIYSEDVAERLGIDHGVAYELTRQLLAEGHLGT